MDSCPKKPKDKRTKKPNWVDLPTDLTMNILRRLDTVDTVKSARFVCSLWWNIYKDPLMWRTIRMSKIDFNHIQMSSLKKIIRRAIDLSCGHVEEVDIDCFVPNNFLKYLYKRANHLRRLRLFHSFYLSNRGLFEFVKKCSLLEELEITVWEDYSSKGCIEEIGRCCPLLKSLNLTRMISSKYYNDAFAIAKTMSGLRHLTLARIVLSNDRLLAILDGCPLLESLDVLKCPYFKLSESLEKRYLEQIKDLHLPEIH